MKIDIVKKLLWICFIVFVSCPPVMAEETNEAPTLPHHQLEQLFRGFIVDASPFPAEDLEVTNFSCRPDHLDLPQGIINYHPLTDGRSGKLGRRNVTLEVSINGRKAGQVRMSGDLHLHGDVVIATSNLKRNSLVSEQDIIISRQDITMLGPDIIKDPSQVIGKQLQSSVRPGSIFFAKLVREPELIKRGELVSILAHNGRLRVSVQGKAQASGARGDLIKVKNMMSRKIIYAQVTNPGEVKVEF